MGFDIVLYFLLYNFVLQKQNLDLSFVVISPEIAAFLITFPVTFIGVLNHYLLWWMSQEGKAKEFISGERAFAVVHQFLYGIYV